MKIQAYQLHSYLRATYKLKEEELFALSKGKRKVILDAVFEKFANHRLYRDGLTNTKNLKDRFDNYRSYDHLENIEMLANDLNITNQKSKDRIERLRRKIHLVRKERFEARKKRRIKQMNQDEYKQKWKPRNKETMMRIERLKKIKEKEQSKEYER